MTPTPERLLAQHARTTALLGVDAIPMGDAPIIAFDHEPGASGRDEHPEAPESELEIKPPPRGAAADPAAVEAANPAAIRAACEHASTPGDKLEALRAKYEADAPHERFGHAPQNIVFGEGASDAQLMFVGEAPGQQEDETGRPFVGRAGQLLDKMIVAMGFSRDTVYICNVLKARPPNNETPTTEQAHASAPYLAEQIRIIAPRVIVTLGRPASNLLLGTDDAMRDLRGRFHAFPPEGAAPGAPMRGLDIPACVVMPTYHPAFLLRSYTQENRRKVWSDLQMVVTRLAENA